MEQRIIICFDLDCFYAQVAAKLDPSLAGYPVAVNQKHLAVTCNYEARRRGVRKMSPVKEALEICPELKVVDGSDLAPFRKASDVINKLWFDKMKKFGLDDLEKKGFDETFMDITEIVDSRINSGEYLPDSCRGKVIGSVEEASRHIALKLCVASQIADDWRKELFSKEGYTCCAGVGCGKIAAKFAVNIEKPNGQAVIFPHALESFLSNQACRHIQGIGRVVAAKLEKLHSKICVTLEQIMEPLEEHGSITCSQVKEISLKGLEHELRNKNLAKFIFDAVRGIDNVALNKTNFLQKNVSVEDTTLPHPTCFNECLPKLEKILDGLGKLLTQRLDDYGDIPTIIKVTACNRCRVSSAPNDQMSSIPNGWSVHSKQTEIHYHSSILKTFENHNFPLNTFLVLSKSLLKDIISKHFSQKSRFDAQSEKLNIVRINIACSAFKPKRIVASNLGGSSLSSWLKKPKIKEISADEPIIVDLREDNTDEKVAGIIDIDLTSETPAGVDETVFHELPPSIQKELMRSNFAQRRNELVDKTTLDGYFKSKKFKVK